MNKLWWPEPLYEMKPYGALALGPFAALIAAARSWAAGSWDIGFAAAMIFAIVCIAYAAAILRLRYVYRRRSRWDREHRT